MSSSRTFTFTGSQLRKKWGIAKSPGRFYSNTNLHPICWSRWISRWEFCKSFPEPQASKFKALSIIPSTHTNSVTYTDLPLLTMGLNPYECIVSWKYLKLKMLLIHITYWTLQLSRIYLKRAQNTYISLQMGKNHPTQGPCYNEVLNISCSSLNTVLKVKNGMVGWTQDGCKSTGGFPLWVPGWLGAGACFHCPVESDERESYHIWLAWEKIEIQKSKYGFYWMLTTFNHRKVEKCQIEPPKQITCINVCECVWNHLFHSSLEKNIIYQRILIIPNTYMQTHISMYQILTQTDTRSI